MIATNFGEIADMIKGKQTWDAAIFQKRAAAFAQQAKIPQEAFELADAARQRPVGREANVTCLKALLPPAIAT